MQAAVRPPFPRVLDSTIISTYRACPQKCFREYFQHFKPKTVSVHLHAGGAYAHGLEAARRAFYVSGQDEATSIAVGLKALIEFYGAFECPPDSAKSLERMCGAFEYYFTQYPMDADRAVPIVLPSGDRGIEFSFAEPIDIHHPETGDPIIYAGRMDMICNFADGIFGEDDKTTSSLGATWAKQWDLRAQFTGYCWGAERGGFPLQGFLVRGVSILKTKYETQQCLTYRPQWMVERWYEGLLQTVSEMARHWEDGTWPFNEGDSCSAYGGCMFRQPCLSIDPSPWLDGNFTRRVWNPLTRLEETAP